jgi:predicted nucleotidyltransferase
MKRRDIMGLRVEKRGEVILQDTRSKISMRYRTVTRAINQEFWNSQSETQNSLYVGSYGRGTAIDASDIDILIALPESEYERFDTVKGNGQSRLLQAVKNAILNAYPRSNVRADGQVVKIDFSDDMKFEILPAFKNLGWNGQWDGTYRYPDTNMGGNWYSTNPRAEQDAMKQKNSSSNGLLYDTCKHFRRVRDVHYSSYHLSGIVIDSFVYAAIGGWHWLKDGETSTYATGDYECVMLDYLTHNEIFQTFYLTAPGSDQSVDTSSSLACLEKVVRYIAE